MTICGTTPYQLSLSAQGRLITQNPNNIIEIIDLYTNYTRQVPVLENDSYLYLIFFNFIIINIKM